MSDTPFRQPRKRGCEWVFIGISSPSFIRGSSPTYRDISQWIIISSSYLLAIRIPRTDTSIHIHTPHFDSHLCSCSLFRSSPSSSIHSLSLFFSTYSFLTLVHILSLLLVALSNAHTHTTSKNASSNSLPRSGHPLHCNSPSPRNHCPWRMIRINESRTKFRLPS